MKTMQGFQKQDELPTGFAERYKADVPTQEGFNIDSTIFLLFHLHTSIMWLLVYV